MLFNSRGLADVGGQCYNLFDCAGSLNCCVSIGPQNQNYCYPQCDRSNGQTCSEAARCGAGLQCCNGSCVSAQTYGTTCQLISATPNPSPIPANAPITIPPNNKPTTTTTTVTSTTQDVTQNPLKPVVIVDPSQSYYDRLASLNYAQNLADTQNNINSVLSEIERLRLEREKLEEE